MKVKSIMVDNVLIGKYLLRNKAVEFIIINPEYRNKGYATALYQGLLDAGEITQPSDSIVCPYILNIWRKLGHQPVSTLDDDMLRNVVSSDEYKRVTCEKVDQHLLDIQSLEAS